MKQIHKKAMSLLLVGILLFSLTACANSADNSSEAENTQSQEAQSTAPSENEDTEVNSDAPDTAASDILVAYFSLAGEQYSVGELYEGNTAIIAKMIAEQTGADLFEIEPVNTYPNDYDGKLEVTEQERSEKRTA